MIRIPCGSKRFRSKTRSTNFCWFGKSKGGSQKIILNWRLHCSKKVNASERCMLHLLSFKSDLSELKNRSDTGWLSTLKTELTPLDKNSKLILPVPENKSRISKPSQSNSWSRMLKSDSLAKSVVGLDGKFRGGEKRLPLYLPPTTRTKSVLPAWRIRLFQARLTAFRRI